MKKLLDANIKGFFYGENKILEEVVLSVQKGEILVLTGNSGCGKTTLLRLLNGLIPNFYDGTLYGAVKLFGKNLEEYKKGELAKYIGNVFQNPKDQFFCDVVEDEIALVGENLGMPRNDLIKKVNQAIERLKISDLRHKSIFQLSGGEQQKVAIAGTLVYDTDIIFFDEPSSSLDYESIETFKEILSMLKNMGKTIIIAEHRLYYLKDLLDRLVYMKDKSIQKIYSREELRREMYRGLKLRTLNENELLVEKEEADGNVAMTFSNISIYQNKKKLIHNLSFQLKENEVMGIIGKNGIGKTTLAKVLCGLTGKSKKISYGTTAKQRLKNSYYVMQDVDAQIFFDTVENELLASTEEISSEFKNQARTYLQIINLWQQRTDHPQKLSGGQKQRLAVITSFVSGRKMIILDEPTSGLDFKNMDILANLITKKSKEIPFIIITHDLELLFKTCNSVLMLEKDKYRKIGLKGNETVVFDFINKVNYKEEIENV